MSQLTQKAIVETTMHLVEQKTVKKITIRDIVEACGITRNTFYYYFHDIYEVLEHALAAGFERIGSESKNLEEFLGASFAFCVEYQKVLYNLYRSAGYEQLADYLKKQVRPHLRRYLECLQVSLEDAGLICVLCEEAIVGTLMRWICNPRRTTDPNVIQSVSDHITSYFGKALRKTVTDFYEEEREEI